MKELPLSIVIGLVILCLPLFLPYFVYDFVEFRNYNTLSVLLGKQYRIVEENLTLYGSETPLSYFPLIWMLFPVVNFLRKNNYRQRLFFVIHSAFILTAVIVLFFALTAEPSFYKGYSNVRPNAGYYSCLAGAVFMLVGSVQLFRAHPRTPERKKPASDDLLDSSI